MDYDKIGYYAAVWGIGSLVGCFRAARDDDFHGFIHLLSVGLVSGSLAFGIIAACGLYPSGRADLGLGVAALIGAMGRQVTDTILVDIGGSIAKKIQQLFGTKKDGDAKTNTDI